MNNQKENICRGILVAVVLLGGAFSTLASVVNYSWTTGFANTGIVPDNDLNGWQDTRTISDFSSGSQILDLNVTLNLSGGFNGDLFGTLVHDSGFVVLLNRVGSSVINPAGFSNPGMNVVLDQSASENIHLVAVPVTGGSYQPDNTWSPATSLTTFNGLDPNGSWTLFLQDVSFGNQSQVLGWGLEISAVPEPVTMALGTFGVLFGGIALSRVFFRKPRFITQE